MSEINNGSSDDFVSSLGVSCPTSKFSILFHKDKEGKFWFQVTDDANSTFKMYAIDKEFIFEIFAVAMTIMGNFPNPEIYENNAPVRYTGTIDMIHHLRNTLIRLGVESTPPDERAIYN